MDHDDKEHEALNAFGQLWKDKFAADSLLVFSTGRSHALYEELRVRLASPVTDALHAGGVASDAGRKPDVHHDRLLWPRRAMEASPWPETLTECPAPASAAIGPRVSHADVLTHNMF